MVNKKCLIDTGIDLLKTVVISITAMILYFGGAYLLYLNLGELAVYAYVFGSILLFVWYIIYRVSLWEYEDEIEDDEDIE